MPLTTQLLKLATQVACFSAVAVGAQSYVPGSTYFGRSNYVQYIAGDLPVIFSAPHGGALIPAEIPDRMDDGSDPNFTTVTDSNTEETALALQGVFANAFGHSPHVITMRLKRTKIDANRSLDQGVYQTNAYATQAWNEFQNYINTGSNAAVAQCGRGFYIDQHGQGHAIQRLELGYLLSASQLALSDTTLNSTTYRNQSSIRTLGTFVSNQFATPFSQILRGSNSFGGLMVARGYPSVPSPAMPDPGSGNSYFDGGYNTDAHTSSGGGPVDGLQIEANNAGVRDTAANRTNYAFAIAQSLDFIFTNYYGIDLRTVAPSIWAVGSGKLAAAASWSNGIVPVAGNYVLFTGPGGAVSNNLAAFSTGSGRMHALLYAANCGGSYTNYGNPIGLVAGLTNFSAWPQTVSNPVTLLAAQTLSASSGPLIFSGNLTNGGFMLSLNAATNLAVNGVISGAGGLAKFGSGTLALTAANSYSGPTTNAAGTISLNATATFGDGSGPLVFAGGDVLLLNTRSAAPLSNAILMTADTAISGNSTLTNSTRILPFSASSIVTSGGTLTLRNIGTNAAATNNAFRVRFTGGGFNFTQPIVLGHPSDLPATLSQLESFNDNLVGDETFSGAISGAGQFRRDAASPTAAGRTILTGANSYSGGTFLIAGTLVVNNTNGSGTGSGGVFVSNTAALSGNGFIAGPVVCAGLISDSPGAGVLTLGGGLDLSAGGTNLWELSALSDTGAGTNFDQLILTGGNLALGGSSRLQIGFTHSALAPTNTSPFWMMSHTWKIISLTSPAANPGATRFPVILSGSYGPGTFTNTTDGTGSVYLSYVAAPAARPVVQSFAPVADGLFSLTSSAETNRTYVLQSATNLINPGWIPVRTNIATSAILSLTNISSSAPANFYRLLVVP